MRTWHRGPVHKITKEGVGFDTRAYREHGFSADDARYFHRWGEDMRAEFRRAIRRIQFFHFYQPEEK